MGASAVPGPSCADDDGLLICLVLLSAIPRLNFFYIFRRADEVSVVVREQAVIAVGIII